MVQTAISLRIYQIADYFFSAWNLLYAPGLKKLFVRGNFGGMLL
jgi:hypothetical protein